MNPSPSNEDNSAIAQMRREYDRGSLNETDVDVDPFAQFARWFDEATAVSAHEANAMTVATVDGEGTPSARTVLLKSFDGAGFVFYTNYESPKGHDLAANPRVALLFYWAALERQVRITGRAEETSAAESDAYFAGRPWGSQIGAAASPQSETIPSRTWLAERFAAAEEEAAVTGSVSRPGFWGGYRVVPERFEFWQGRPNRLHDRLVYRRELADEEIWVIERLAP